MRSLFRPITVLITFFLITHWAYAEIPKVEEGQPLPSNLFVELAKAVNPAVVNISTTQLPKVPQLRRDDPYFQFFQQFFGPQFQFNPSVNPRHSLGTGFIIREDGLIITNNHVIEAADIIKVQLSETSDELIEAKVIGQDKRTDIALIKITTKKKLPTVKLGSSKNLQVGEWVSAFGNPYGHGHTMTKGIVSAIGRDIKELNRFSFIQTDASINPGNSGGPLVNTKGEVIGVNTAIDARAQGIGFAIPIDDIKSIIPVLEKEGHIKRGFIGIYLDEVTPQAVQALNLKTNTGALVIRVMPGGPAQKAGLKAYDIITEFNKVAIEGPIDLTRSILDTVVGQTVEAKVNRAGKGLTLKIRIAEHPDDQQLAVTTPRPKRFSGITAPFNLGFKVANYTKNLAKEWKLPKLNQPHPIVVQVDPGSVASKSQLEPGDVILDINRRSVSTATSVPKFIKKGQHNILRVLKGENVVLIHLPVK